MTQSVFPSPGVGPDDNGVVRGTVQIAALPERVFKALTDPQELASWWGSEETYRTHDWHVDARPGGKWSARTLDAAGNEGTLGGTFSVVDPAHTIEHTWLASWDELRPSTVRYDIEPAVVDDVAGTRLTVTHTTAKHTGPAMLHTFDWNGVITSLARQATRTHSFSASVTRCYTVPHVRSRTLRPARILG